MTESEGWRTRAGVSRGKGELSYGTVIGCLGAEATLLIEKLSTYIPSSQRIFCVCDGGDGDEEARVRARVRWNKLRELGWFCTIWAVDQSPRTP